ncbi:SlyX protein [Paracoccus yeei]|jgi:SlyX protein|uniref:SlyX protein n=2 Tax=Paracoccus TaxID=265 RepID=A0A1V0GTI7_9RHOB|nr:MULTISPECIES: SlyX family protein [Paracoccus]ARC37163.1 SlyX protein [Paracoccus yeei]ATQ55784.1 SlyX protein [Paracoccus yeei]AWX93497.1 SlyX protein [Paracoccus mutanolyticus]MBY0136223.1 SlyX family protein [Paracoccus yeei]OWJ89215.1 SlyX protein [Paracoccus yeei]
MDKDERILRLEEAVAHLGRVVEDLSEVVARQEREILRLSRRVGLLMEREAEREAEGGTIPLADQRPPHW